MAPHLLSQPADAQAIEQKEDQEQLRACVRDRAMQKKTKMIASVLAPAVAGPGSSPPYAAAAMTGRRTRYTAGHPRKRLGHECAIMVAATTAVSPTHRQHRFNPSFRWGRIRAQPTWVEYDAMRSRSKKLLRNVIKPHVVLDVFKGATVVAYYLRQRPGILPFRCGDTTWLI